MKAKVFLFILLIFSKIYPQQRDTLVIFSEVMFYNSPTIPNGEFVELFNTSFTDTIDLEGWKIQYYTSQADIIVSAGFGTKVAPRKFAVIFEGDYTGGYSVPEDALILKISDNSFGTSGMANTSDRNISLLNANNEVIWTYTYSANNNAGYSDEKILLIGDNSELNWGNSLVLNGTPGKFNSVSIREHDVAVTSVIINPEFPILYDNVQVSFLIKNLGTHGAYNFYIEYKFDYGDDGSFEYVFPPKFISSLNVNDSIIVLADSVIRNIQSKIRVFCSVNFSLDQNSANDTLSYLIEPGIPRNSILITEIMFDPRTGEPEWVELFNNTENQINLKGWKISDVLSTPTVVPITNTDYMFNPKSFLVLTSNNAINNFYDTIPSPILYVSVPALNNDKDGVVVYDNRGAVIDSVFYFSDWSLPKKSLERIRFDISSILRENWGASISDSGGTPGKMNSLSEAKIYPPMSLVINEIMYEPLTGFAEYVEVYNASSDTINIAGWKIIEGSGKTFSLTNNKFNLEPSNFFLLTSDSSIFSLFPYLSEYPYNSFIRITQTSDFSLSNSEDVIILKDAFGNTIDSVKYSNKWHNPEIDDYKGRSLERINPLLASNYEENWSTSTNSSGGTPLLQNSIFTRTSPLSSKIEISPNPFSPDNDGFEDFTIISYQLPVETSNIRIRIFDSYGRLVRTLIDNEPTSSTGKIIFDGLDNEKRSLRLGIYIVLIEAINQQQGLVELIKKPIVIAKKLK